MKVLIACEESQAVTIEFRKLGHEAYSCDIIDCSGGYPEWHIKGDCIDAILSRKWDMIIMHPPCTKLSVSGNGTYGTGKPKNHERIEAIAWTHKLFNLAVSVCDRVAMENPVGVLNSVPGLPKPQYINPWQFGHMETKKTGLWLHNLPELKETKNVKSEMDKLPPKEKNKIWYASPGPERAKLRSKTYQGIAEAMANQWNF